MLPSWVDVAAGWAAATCAVLAARWALARLAGDLCHADEHDLAPDPGGRRP